MKGIFLLLGTNLGDKLQNLQQAKNILESQAMSVIDYSSIYESAPWGEPDQDWFLNMILQVDTILQPENLLETCLKTEQQMGRERFKKWGSRLIDIDLLYYDNQKLQTAALTLPHPAIQMRKFTLLPLVEMIPHEIHPLLNRSQEELLDICPDHLTCRKTELNIKI